MTTAKPRNPATGPAALPQVAHDRPVPDSRGLVLMPPDDLAWMRGKHSLTAVPGGYAPEGEAHATTAPCLTCGEPAPIVPYTYATENPYGACPAQEAEACAKRGVARAVAERAAMTEPAVNLAEATPKPAAKATTTAARKRPVRPSQARKTLLGKPPARTAKAAPEDTTKPPGGAA